MSAFFYFLAGMGAAIQVYSVYNLACILTEKRNTKGDNK